MIILSLKYKSQSIIYFKYLRMIHFKFKEMLVRLYLHIFDSSKQQSRTLYIL